MTLSLEHSASADLANLSDGPPHCPACGGWLVIRTAKKGRRSGAQFWGCLSYLDCSESFDLDAFPEAVAARMRRKAAR